jgi:hypothetical protein
MSINTILSNTPILNSLSNLQLGGLDSQIFTSPIYQIASLPANQGLNNTVTFTNKTSSPIYVLQKVVTFTDSQPSESIVINGVSTASSTSSFILPIGAIFKVDYPYPSQADSSAFASLQYLANSELTVVVSVVTN